MTQDRVYRKAMTRNQAIDEILKYRSIQFDPKITDLFIEILNNHPEL